jgi:hypothetical protein
MARREPSLENKAAAHVATGDKKDEVIEEGTVSG